jgi:hypothetical protein
MTGGIPGEVLEKRAADQRRQLHNSVAELRQTVQDKFDVKRNVRNHLPLVAGALALFGLAAGYSIAGVFTTD